MHRKIDNLHPSDILSSEYFFDGQLISYGCEILDCEDIEYEVLSETALISGIVYATCEVELLEYNAVRDSGEDRYSSVGEKISLTKFISTLIWKEMRSILILRLPTWKYRI